jgi:hypothetical protein
MNWKGFVRNHHGLIEVLSQHLPVVWSGSDRSTSRIPAKSTIAVPTGSLAQGRNNFEQPSTTRRRTSVLLPGLSQFCDSTLEAATTISFSILSIHSILLDAKERAQYDLESNQQRQRPSRLLQGTM